MIRPEALHRLREARDALIGLALIGVGLWLILRPGVILPGLGAFVALAGLALGVVGLRRARFLARGEGPGVVQVVEGQIGYFGPRTGGVVALDEIARLSLSADGRDWLIRAGDGRVLTIPRAARGAEALFDAFASLDGLDIAQLLRRIEGAPYQADQPIWQRPSRALLT
ncbi:MAG: hypothetical protein HLUCCA12_09110 [Rhodobacteraceae bacterium HLUCCA12]|nr:MAG: hypothetical protein HLUCCA12_09110 [Rhodobacteraceae bacterium HLUCCA12]